MNSFFLKKYLLWVYCDSSLPLKNHRKILLTTLILAIIIFVTGCTEKIVTDPVVTKPGVCQEPASAVITKKPKLDLAGLNFGDFALGKLTLENNPAVKTLLSEAARDSLAHDYIICRAIARTGEPDDTELRAYFLNMIYFMNAQPLPSSEEIQEWQKNNPYPKKQGKLELSGPQRRGDSWELLIPNDSPVEQVGVINAGEGPLTWWFAHFPSRQFYSSFPRGESNTLPASGNKVFNVVRTTNALGDTPYSFKIKTNTGEEAEIIIIGEGTKLYASLGSELKRNILEWQQDVEEEFWNQHPNPSDRDMFKYEADLFEKTSEKILESADILVQEKYPYVDSDIKDLIASQILAKAGYTEESSIAYFKFAQKDSDIIFPGLPWETERMNAVTRSENPALKSPTFQFRLQPLPPDPA